MPIVSGRRILVSLTKEKIDYINDDKKTFVATPSSALLYLVRLVFFLLPLLVVLLASIESGKIGGIFSGVIGSGLLICYKLFYVQFDSGGSYQDAYKNTYIQCDVMYSFCQGVDGNRRPTIYQITETV